MIIKEEDHFFKLMSSPQQCDYCMKKKQPIAHIILHPLYSMDEKANCIMTAYTVAKKCMECIENEHIEEEE